MSRRLAVMIAAGALILGGCTSNEPSGDEASNEAAEDTTPISVTIPAERMTPFCTAVNDLNDQLVTADDDIDVEALIIDTYRSILPDVPPEIADDFQAVLTALETGVPAPTAPPVTQPELAPSTDPDTGDTVAQGPDATTEFFFPASTPSQRVNEYVSFACQGAANNPGPPATAPVDGDASADAG